MPTYEYRCKDCGEDLEVVQSFTDDPLDTCPACGGSLKKVFGSVGISFKGSGFYKTDSRGTTKTATKTDTAAASSDSSTTSSDSSSSSSSSGTSDSGSSGSSSSSDSSSGSTPAKPSTPASTSKKETTPA